MAVRRVSAWAVSALVLWALGVAAPDASASASACLGNTPTYTDACGPTFDLPGWGDAGGWSDPSQYSTIQLADVNGDGTDELLGRNDQGLEVWTFDTTYGQWRPQVDANDTPEVVSDFRSPRPGETLATDFTRPEYFSTIHTGNVNAGYGLFGMVEEVREEQARAQIETNLFGALWVTKAALPILREQGSGHIIQVSSIGGVNAFPTLGLYHASKWGLEGLSQALAAEVGPLGIKVTLVEPTGYSTDWAGPSSVQADHEPAYDGVREAAAQAASARRVNRGDPHATGPAILELVDAADPPLRTFFGEGTLDMIREEYARRIATWEAWDDLARRAHG